jgi:hypothetical protein
MVRRASLNVAILFLLGAWFGSAQPAAADSLGVRSGGFSADYGDNPSPWDFVGDGFDFQMTIIGAEESYWGPFMTCAFQACAAGSPVDMSTRIIGFEGLGDVNAAYPFAVSRPARIGAMTYPVLFFRGNLDFAAPTVNAAEGFFREPFRFVGHITASTDSTFASPPVFEADLHGSGIAQLSLNDYIFGPDGLYSVTSIGYQFTDPAPPVPEPSTLLLLGSVCAGAAVRRWRTRSR